MRRYAPVLIAAAALLAACAIGGADAPAPAERAQPFDPFVIDQLFNSEGDAPHDIRTQFLAMAGREDLTTRPTRECPVRAGDPLDEITRRAAQAQIVIINEAHYAPQHRAFIAQVAARLRPLGYDIFAAETFDETALTPRDHDWPLLNDGFYSREPVFGALLRQARALGYRFVAYEARTRAPDDASPAESIAHREAIQAQNLIDRVLSENPNARVLVHVGHGHLRERPDQSGNEWMALRLKNLTGIDPLTIEQTWHTTSGEDFVLCDVDAGGAADIIIGAPELRFAHGRPLWRQREGARIVQTPRPFAPAREKTIIEARHANEPDEAVPADRLYLRPGDDVPLLLTPGRYRIEAWTQEHGWSAPVEIGID